MGLQRANGFSTFERYATNCADEFGQSGGQRPKLQAALATLNALITAGCSNTTDLAVCIELETPARSSIALTGMQSQEIFSVGDPIATAGAGFGLEYQAPGNEVAFWVNGNGTAGSRHTHQIQGYNNQFHAMFYTRFDSTRFANPGETWLFNHGQTLVEVQSPVGAPLPDAPEAPGYSSMENLTDIITDGIWLHNMGSGPSLRGGNYRLTFWYLNGSQRLSDANIVIAARDMYANGSTPLLPYTQVGGCVFHWPGPSDADLENNSVTDLITGAVLTGPLPAGGDPLLAVREGIAHSCYHVGHINRSLKFVGPNGNNQFDFHDAVNKYGFLGEVYFQSALSQGAVRLMGDENNELVLKEAAGVYNISALINGGSTEATSPTAAGEIPGEDAWGTAAMFNTGADDSVYAAYNGYMGAAATHSAPALASGDFSISNWKAQGALVGNIAFGRGIKFDSAAFLALAPDAVAWKKILTHHANGFDLHGDPGALHPVFLELLAQADDDLCRIIEYGPEGLEYDDDQRDLLDWHGKATQTISPESTFKLTGTIEAGSFRTMRTQLNLNDGTSRRVYHMGDPGVTKPTGTVGVPASATLNPLLAGPHSGNVGVGNNMIDDLHTLLAHLDAGGNAAPFAWFNAGDTIFRFGEFDYSVLPAADNIAWANAAVGTPTKYNVIEFPIKSDVTGIECLPVARSVPHIKIIGGHCASTADIHDDIQAGADYCSTHKFLSTGGGNATAYRRVDASCVEIDLGNNICEGYSGAGRPLANNATATSVTIINEIFNGQTGAGNGPDMGNAFYDFCRFDSGKAPLGGTAGDHNYQATTSTEYPINYIGSAVGKYGVFNTQWHALVGYNLPEVSAEWALGAFEPTLTGVSSGGTAAKSVLTLVKGLGAQGGNGSVMIL